MLFFCYNDNGDNMSVISIIYENLRGREQPFFVMEPEIVNIIKDELGSDAKYYDLDDYLDASDKIKISPSDLQTILERVLFHAELECDGEFVAKAGADYLQEFENKFQEFLKIRGTINMQVSIVSVERDLARNSFCNQFVKNAIYDNYSDTIEKFIKVTHELRGIVKKFYKTRDLSGAKNKIIDSLKSICQPQEIQEYENKYQEFLDEKPLDLNKLENYLKDLQKIVLEDWKKKITKVEDYIPGKPFRFLCHSTNSTSFDGEFYTRYVSTSLLTENFMGTYRSGFGFILSPDNIVGASGRDMYVNNSAVKEDSLSSTYSLPRIDSMEIVLKDLEEQRKENEKATVKSSVYSEVVVDGFKPLAIFCVTNGSKELDPNYLGAKKLEEQFSLPIKEFDLTLYKDKEELVSLRKGLIDGIHKSLGQYIGGYEDHYYENFEFFWEKYLELKKKEEFTKEDILKLYHRNLEILSLRIDTENLFSNEYNLEEMQYILLKNGNYSLEKIFKGNFSPLDLKNLVSVLGKYKNDERLLKLFPNINKLLELIEIFDIDYQDVELIKKEIPITINAIIKVLKEKMYKKKEEFSSKLEDYHSQKERLEIEVVEKERKIKKNKEYRMIIDQEIIYLLAGIDIKNEQSKLDILDLDGALMSDLQRFEKEKNDSLPERTKLLNHKFWNRKKLKKINSNLEFINSKIKEQKEKIDVHNQTKKEIEQMVCEIRQDFLKQTGIDFEIFNQKLEEAQNSYDVFLEVQLEYQIKEIRAQISNLEEEIKKINLENVKMEQVIETQQRIL